MVLAFVATALVACSTPEEEAAKAQRRAFEAQEEVVKRRLHLVDEYQKCVKAAAGDQIKIEACKSYLNAADALR